MPSARAAATLLPPEVFNASRMACNCSASTAVGKGLARAAGTGGTAVRLDSVERAERSGQGWLILARLTGTWPDQSQSMTMDCRATGSSVTAFDVR